MMSLSVKTAMAWLTYIVIWALQATSFAIPKQTYHSAKPSKSFLYAVSLVLVGKECFHNIFDPDNLGFVETV